MFTGLVQSLGTVRASEDDGREGRMQRIADSAVAANLRPGDSVAINGTCLTVTAREGEEFTALAGPETLVRTNLGALAPGDRVNLEPALRVGDPLGGHFVTGHIDATGTMREKTQTGDWLMVWFESPPEFDELLVRKGSIAVDGVSLTVVDTDRGRFSVMLIPHTRDHTTLGFKEPGAVVNLEFDLIAKHVRRLFQNISITI